MPFYKELGNQGIKAEDLPVVAFSVGEEELRGIDTKPLVGQLAAWNYFMSMDNAGEQGLHRQVEGLRQGQEPARRRQARDQRPMEATYIGIQMWAHAVEQAHTTDVDAVRQAVGHQKVKAPSGFEIEMDAANHHLHKPVVIGEVKADGQFKVVWKTPGPIRAQAWSPFIPESAKKVADWTYPMGLRQLHGSQILGGRHDPGQSTLTLGAPDVVAAQAAQNIPLSVDLVTGVLFFETGSPMATSLSSKRH